MKAHTFKTPENHATDFYYFDNGFDSAELEKISKMVGELPFYNATTAAGEID